MFSGVGSGEKFPKKNKKSVALKRLLRYTLKACERRRSGKLLSYQVISAENCPCRTGAKEFADFCFVPKNMKTHGSVCKHRETGKRRKINMMDSLYENSEKSTK
jgi:hypothetical protein